jgi:hypothetical protein
MARLENLQAVPGTEGQANGFQVNGKSPAASWALQNHKEKKEMNKQIVAAASHDVHTFFYEGQWWELRFYETFGEDIRTVKAADPSRVLTLVDDYCGKSIVLPGFHFVNRLGYYILPEGGAQ